MKSIAMNSIRKALILSLVVSLLVTACRDRDKAGRLLDTPTSGHVKIAVDESLRPLIEAEISTFEALYRRADIEPFYLPEAEAIAALMEDSVKVAVVTRRFTQEEKDYFKNIRITPTERDVAISAIALIVHRDNPDSLISMDQFHALLQGKISKWSDLGGKNNAGIEIVFDNPNSGLIRHIKD